MTEPITLFDLEKIMFDNISLQIEFPNRKSIWLTSGLLWAVDRGVRKMPIELIKQNAGGGLTVSFRKTEHADDSTDEFE